MKILVFIPTYNRPQMCLDLLKDIKKEQGDHSINVVVLEDCSAMNYKPVREYLSGNFKTSTYISNPQNNGKKLFWKTVNRGFEKARFERWDYFIMLGDDLRLTNGFFDIAISRFRSVKNVICLNLLTEFSRQSVKMWTDVEPKNQNEHVMRTGWVDMCFIANRKFFDTLKYTINEVPRTWGENPTKSSGVGMQISKRIIKSGQYFHQVKQSLVIHDDHPSMMHPNERKNNKLITNHQIISEKRTASLATMPNREASLKKTIESIYPQVDELHVYLNEWDHVPEFLSRKGISVYRSQDEAGDLGDVGKFYTAEHIKGYHLTIDDDLVYPEGYVNKMIAAVEKYGRKKAVSIHGRTFSGFPATSYYNGHAMSVSCLKTWNNDIPVHVCGTGVLAYHTDTIKVKVSDFHTLNMSDIWFSLLCENQNVDRIAIEHQEGWLKYTQIPFNSTIAGWHYNSDSLQTSVLNSINWKKTKFMATDGLIPEVARKYYVPTIKPGFYNFKNFGDIDLRTLTLEQADKLYERKFPFLKLKILPKVQTKTEPLEPLSTNDSKNGTNDTLVSGQDKKNVPVDIAAFRRNKAYINKLLTMNWEDLNHQEKQIFNDEAEYFQKKKASYFQIVSNDRKMKTMHAKMRALPKSTQNDDARAELLQNITELDTFNTATWTEIDTWLPPTPKASEEMKIKIAQREAVATARKIKAHDNYIWRGEKELAKSGIDTKRKSYLEKEIAKRKAELIELGEPYSRKSRKK